MRGAAGTPRTSSARPSADATGDGRTAATVGPDELRAMIRGGGDFVLVETGSPRAYRRGHLPGAKHLPPGRVRERAPDLLPDRSADIVVYSPEGGPGLSARTAGILREMGYSDVRVCPGVAKAARA